MSLLDRALAKLTITAYSDRELEDMVGKMSAMYNPDTLSISYQNEFKDNEFINTAILSNDYSKRVPGELTLNLVFDARMPGNSSAITDQLSHLHMLCCTINPTKNELHYLKISWGNMNWGGLANYYAGRMKSMAIGYTLFDRDGTPLRASVTLSLLADPSIKMQMAEQRLQSPPVAVLAVPASPVLPLIAASAASYVIGGINYLGLAWANDLDNLDDIQPGQTLAAPAQEGVA
ncbi:hypothetical protein [Burkholderia ubonensis]|uniref:CIS tube protein n=1 Tax=Burkholderia ubonensis TaxID=101571 RepID=UPI000759E931|nr:hypothetical protein [Burkholderia ubonensis]KVN28369.1 hypothetical protein WJ64_16670 [Burkholderia ubonensis]